MTKFSNQEGLNKALNIYRSAMRSFIVCCLEKVHPEGVEELIVASLNSKAANKFEQDLHLYKGNIEASIHINTFPHIIRNRWGDVFEQQFNPYSNVRSVISLIVDGRNQCAHLDTEDLDLDYTWTYLFLISDVLGQINRPDAKREIETILDELFPDDTDERIADMTKQLDAAETEKTELEKQVKTISDRLKEVEAEQFASEKRLETESFKLKIAVAGKTVAEERLSDISNRFEEAEGENAAYKKRMETIPAQLEAAEAEKAKYEKAVKAASNQLATLKTVNAQLEERLETTSTQLEEVEEELVDEEVEEELVDYKERLTQLEIEVAEETTCEDDFTELEEDLPPSDNAPDSVTFHDTTFTKYLDKYYVDGDDISQGFWHYWQSLGREGKQEMRDAGWSVEKVNGEWEVTVSPEDFQAWIIDEVTELNNLLDFLRGAEPPTQSVRPSNERTSLPTVKEMVQPALELFADREEHRRVEMINLLTEHFLLDDDERGYLSKTGQVEKHLMKEGLIERTRTGYYRITTYGLEVVNDVPF